MTDTLRALRILGVMTGTSCDGLDAACIEVGPEGWRALWSRALPYPKTLRERVFALQKTGSRHALLDWLKLNRDLGQWYAKAIASLVESAPEGQRPDAIANHGQTVAHHPGEQVTLQLGDPTFIARATGLTVVARFRDGDVAAGGQGAPLLPMFHRLLARTLGGAGVSIHNIGGISNFSYVAPDGRLLAFDTGPGNLWIDGAAARATKGRLKMDIGGKLGRKGTADPKAAAALLRMPYFKKKPPKSTGRDDFYLEQLLKVTRARGDDLVATATEATAATIADAYERFVLKAGLPLEAVYVCGGGAKNPFLLERIGARLPGTRVASLELAGIDPTWIEAQGFAYFGYLSLLGQPVGGAWTGVDGFGPPGQIVPGENWLALVPRLQELARGSGTQSPSRPMPRPSQFDAASP